MTADQISVLLGRPLSATETANCSTYQSLAKARVSDLICSNIQIDHDTYTFELREGYRTLNLPIFEELTSVTIDGNLVDESTYSVKQGNSFNGTWFNSIVFNNLQTCNQVEVEADWGFSSYPIDLQKMIAEQFGIMSSTLTADQIARKQVEDFSIQFNETASNAFTNKYAATIAKYSCCSNGAILSGSVYGRYGDYGRIFSL